MSNPSKVSEEIRANLRCCPPHQIPAKQVRKSGRNLDAVLHIKCQQQVRKSGQTLDAVLHIKSQQQVRKSGRNLDAVLHIKSQQQVRKSGRTLDAVLHVKSQQQVRKSGQTLDAVLHIKSQQQVRKSGRTLDAVLHVKSQQQVGEAGAGLVQGVQQQLQDQLRPDVRRLCGRFVAALGSVAGRDLERGAAVQAGLQASREAGLDLLLAELCTYTQRQDWVRKLSTLNNLDVKSLLLYRLACRHAVKPACICYWLSFASARSTRIGDCYARSQQ